MSLEGIEIEWNMSASVLCSFTCEPLRAYTCQHTSIFCRLSLCFKWHVWLWFWHL